MDVAQTSAGVIVVIPAAGGGCDHGIESNRHECQKIDSQKEYTQAEKKRFRQLLFFF